MLLSTFAYAQQEDLLEIIKSNAPKEIRQQKIDSFLQMAERKIPPKTLADCYHDLGSKWHYKNWKESRKKNDLDKAIQVTEKAIAIKKNPDSIDAVSLKKSLYNLGYFHSLNDNIYDAVKAYEELIEIGDADSKTQFANLELGKAYGIIGDFHKAIESIKRVTSFYGNDLEYARKIIEAQINMANTYSLMGFKEYSDQIKIHLKKADSILKKTKDENSDLENEIYQMEGNRLLETGDYAEAISYHQRILKDSIFLFPDDLARVYNSIAYSQIGLRDFEGAMVNLKKAISQNPNYSDIYENLGDLYLAKNEFKKGLFFYQQAIIYATDRTKEINYKKLPTIQELELASEKIFLLNHIVTKANGWLQYYESDTDKEHLLHALETFSLADQLVDLIRFESTENQSKLYWREKGASLYMKAVEVCYLLGKPDKAFHFMERNKALLLLEDLTNEQAKEIAKLPTAVAKLEFDLKRRIYLSENELSNFKNTSGKTLDSLKQYIYENKHRYERFLDSLNTAFPEYAKIKKKVEVITYQNFKEHFLAGEEVVLQYILNSEQGYGLLSAPQNTIFFKIEEVPTLNDQIADVYERLTDLVSSHKKIAEYNQISNRVFQKLIPAAVYKCIKGKKLTIVSDYSLQQIPFEALITAVDKSTYLIEDVEIRYSYSISYLEGKKHIVQNTANEFMGMAPIKFDATALPALPFSGEEIKTAEKIFPGAVFLNGEATKTNFLKNLNGYKIVHLSTHADVGKNGNPWIAFSDQKLFINEIYATKNRASLVVLSACNTSLGELKKGEGVMSLARGFFHAGAQSVISSLWLANDRTSKQLMTTFYKGLDQGMTKSAALRKAKLDYIKDYRGTTVSPSYWAALIIIGDNTPVKSVLSQFWYWIFSLLGMILLALLLFYVIKKGKLFQFLH